LAKRLEDLAPPGLLERARRAVSLVDGVSRVRVLCHYDPDGTTSAAILTRTLMRRGKRVHATMSHALDKAAGERLRAESNELLVVSDMGSAQLDVLESLGYPVIVLDHHRPLRDTEKIVHINPHLFGVDGAREMCGATTTWLFSLLLDEGNWDLAGIAAAGAIGDKQDIGGFSGVNGALFAEAIERKILTPERRLALRDGPLAQTLAHSISPYFRGIGGRPVEAASFLKEAGFEPDVALRNLDPAQRRRLTSVLAVRLVEQGAAPEALDVLVEDRYWIEPQRMYAQDLEAYVNGCDRLGHEGLGLAVCLGDADALARAESLLDQYSSKVLEYLVRFESEGLYAKKHVQFFYCEEPTIAGSVAGAGMQFYFDQSKPVVGLSVMDRQTKVSARGTRTMISRGLDLGAALRDAAARFDGNGGGHDIAAGATIPKGKEEKFLDAVDEIVGAQLAPAAQ
jgi:single-stranded-DNA-specific exonuclease